MAKLEKVEGIGPIYAADLRRAGVRGTKDLLNKGGTPKGRDEIARASGIVSLTRGNAVPVGVGAGVNRAIYAISAVVISVTLLLTPVGELVARLVFVARRVARGVAPGWTAIRYADLLSVAE